MYEASEERRRIVRHAELWLLTEGAAGGLRDQLARRVLFIMRSRSFAIVVIAVTLGVVRVGALNLDKTLAANVLTAAASVVEVRGIREEANRTFVCILVQEYLDWLSVDIRIVR